MWYGKRVLRSCLLWPMVCWAFSGVLSAGHRPAANTSLASGCVAGECRPSPARVPAIQGALLQAAALSVVAGPGASQQSSRSLKALPRRSKVRLPSWYRRAQAAQLRDQSRPAERLGARSVQSTAPVRVREPANPAAVGSHSREPLRLARAATSTAATSERPKAGLKSQPRPEARAARRRRLIGESLEQSFETQIREPRQVQRSECGDSATWLGSDNFTSEIRGNPDGNYVLVEPVVINSTKGLPLNGTFGNESFTGCIHGTEDNSLRLDLEKEDGDLAVFGGLENAHINLTVSDSRLVSHNGSVALFGGQTKSSLLDLRVGNSTLTAMGGAHAALVEHLVDAGNNLALSMNDTNITALRNGTKVERVAVRIGGANPGNRLAAAPVALASGERSNLLVHNSHGNRVEAWLQERPGDNSDRPLAVASLGWAYVDEKKSDNDLIQVNISDNSVRANFTDLETGDGSAHASLAGSYAPGTNEVHNLEQWAVEDNQVEARVSGDADGIAVASLGMVHDAHPQGLAWIFFHIRQQQCRNNTVTASVPSSNSSMAVTSLALATDDSSCGSRCQMRCEGDCTSLCRTWCPFVDGFWVLHSQVSDNTMVTEGGNPGVNSATLVGSVGLPRGNTKSYLFLFSEGDSVRPLSVKNDVVISDRALASVQSTVVDRDGYSFNCTNAARAGACPLDRFEQSSTQPEGWKEINRFYCDEARSRFEGGALQQLPGCPDAMFSDATICHSPGETFLKLVPVPETDRWLLVTRQTWPDGSRGNSSSTDLFRLLPFSAAADPVFLGITSGDGPGYDPVGSVYNGTRVVPEDGGSMQTLVVDGAGGTLHLVSQDKSQSSLRWATFSLDAEARRQGPFDSTSWSPPSGGELMLLSQEADGVNLWLRRQGTVEGWSRADIEKNATTPTRSITLSSDDDPPLALARDGDFLYSLHKATAANASMEPEYRVQRWNLTSNSQDRCWTVDWQDPLSGRLTANNGTLQLAPGDAMPVGNGTLALKPRVPDIGGCLTWDRVTRSLAQLNLSDSGSACPTVVPRSSDTGAAVTTTAALSSTSMPDSSVPETSAAMTTSATGLAPTSAALQTTPVATASSRATAVSSSSAQSTSAAPDRVSLTATPSPSPTAKLASSSSRPPQASSPVLLMTSSPASDGLSSAQTSAAVRSSVPPSAPASSGPDIFPSRTRPAPAGSTATLVSSGQLTASSPIMDHVPVTRTTTDAFSSMLSMAPEETTATGAPVTASGANVNAAASVLALLVPAGITVGAGAVVYKKYCRKARSRSSEPERLELEPLDASTEFDNPFTSQQSLPEAPATSQALPPLVFMPSPAASLLSSPAESVPPTRADSERDLL